MSDGSVNGVTFSCDHTDDKPRVVTATGAVFCACGFDRHETFGDLCRRLGYEVRPIWRDDQLPQPRESIV